MKVPQTYAICKRECVYACAHACENTEMYWCSASFHIHMKQVHFQEFCSTISPQKISSTFSQKYTIHHKG